MDWRARKTSSLGVDGHSLRKWIVMSLGYLAAKIHPRKDSKEFLPTREEMDKHMLEAWDLVRDRAKVQDDLYALITDYSQDVPRSAVPDLIKVRDAIGDLLTPQGSRQ